MSAEILDQFNQRPEIFDPLANHPDPEGLYLDSLRQSSLLAGREKPFNWELDNYLSEAALHRYRAVVDIEAMIHLAEAGPYDIPMTDDGKATLRSIYDPKNFQSDEVLRIDHLGHRHPETSEWVKPLEHDVKAMEVYVGYKMDSAGLGKFKQWLHYAETSEDTNNLAWNLMLRDAVNNVVVPSVTRVADRLAHFSVSQAETPLLGITHAQNASPQTVGKRFGKSLYGTTEVIKELQAIKLTGKYGGAVGNHNPLVVLHPEFDWDEYSKDFVESFGFEYSAVEDQRNNHLAVTNLLNTVGRVALVTHQNVQNAWLNIRDNVLVQIPIEGTKGSSTMSHKINPWRLENSEALFEQARLLIHGAESGLVESRDERDLSDHDWQRGYGDMLGRVVAGLNYVTCQLDLIRIDEDKARATLQGTAEVLSELLQTAGRALGDADAYNGVTKATQGKKLTLEEMREVIREALPDSDLKTRLLEISPEDYVGLAPKKAREAAIGWHACRTEISKGVLDWRSGIDAVLFDLDDTLVFGDKQELAARMEAIGQDLQADITADEFSALMRTNGWSATVEAFVKAHNSKHPDQTLTKDQFLDSNRKISGSFDHMLTIAEGAHELLDNLDRKGKKKALVTARGPSSLPRVLDLHDLSNRFDVTVHGLETEFGKPHPHPIGLALGRLGISGKRAMMVGDHQLYDIVSANAHGMMSVLVKDGELDPMGAVPTMQVKNLQQLARKFAR